MVMKMSFREENLSRAALKIIFAKKNAWSCMPHQNVPEAPAYHLSHLDLFQLEATESIATPPWMGC